jgi:hypothetical protein
MNSLKSQVSSLKSSDFNLTQDLKKYLLESYKQEILWKWNCQRFEAEDAGTQFTLNYL